MSRCVDFKFKRGENCEPHVKICPHRQDQLDIALDPSGAEVINFFWKLYAIGCVTKINVSCR